MKTIKTKKIKRLNKKNKNWLDKDLYKSFEELMNENKKD